MKSWRLDWTLKELFSIKNYKNHADALRHPSRFWIALFLKFIPDLWRKPLLLELKQGGSFFVRKFMTLYIYKEIFIDKCYDNPVLSGLDPVIVDIGANTGLFAIRMKQLYPESQIFCFEPNELNFEQLSINVQASKMSFIKPFQFGVGGRSRKEKLYTHKHNLGGHSIIQSEANSDEYTEIEIVAISEVFENLNIDKCDLLKIDCEGAEYEIIKSINRELAMRIEKIIFEPTASVYDVNELLEHLTNVGFVMIDNEGLYIAVKPESVNEIIMPQPVKLVS
ncbi:MAG TPA: FkbM family methyltransferase [Pedobacter sp.]|jgi:FkbM family methyltransferase